MYIYIWEDYGVTKGDTRSSGVQTIAQISKTDYVRPFLLCPEVYTELECNTGESL